MVTNIKMIIMMMTMMLTSTLEMALVVLSRLHIPNKMTRHLRITRLEDRAPKKMGKYLRFRSICLYPMFLPFSGSRRALSRLAHPRKPDQSNVWSVHGCSKHVIRETHTSWLCFGWSKECELWYLGALAGRALVDKRSVFVSLFVAEGKILAKDMPSRSTFKCIAKGKALQPSGSQEVHRRKESRWGRRSHPATLKRKPTIKVRP
ncbi:hypothetical protein F5Y06DRAFT_131064 [Hypoxylon sp. FL0890]|nr:hypothetical protein F5Y06DRAFT_131064 [Hypoxylon sp. FL0890]